MTTFHFQTHVSDSGVITLPPEYRNRKVAVVLVEEQGESEKKFETAPPRDDDWRPDPTAVHRFHESRKLLPAVEITDEEIEKLKHERRMRKML